MECKKCKKTYDDSFAFCPYCGKKKEVIHPGVKTCALRIDMIKAFNDNELIDFAENMPKGDAKKIRDYLDAPVMREVYVCYARKLSFNTRVRSERTHKCGHVDSFGILQTYLVEPTENICQTHSYRCGSEFSSESEYITFLICVEKTVLLRSMVPYIGKTVFFTKESIPYDVERMEERSAKAADWFRSTVDEFHEAHRQRRH